MLECGKKETRHKKYLNILNKTIRIYFFSKNRIKSVIYLDYVGDKKKYFFIKII